MATYRQFYTTEVTLPQNTASTTVTLPTPVLSMDAAFCWYDAVLADASFTGNTAPAAHIAIQLTATNTITLTRMNATNVPEYTIRVYLVEGSSGVSVQRGQRSMTTNPQSQTITGSPAMNRSFIINTYFNDGSSITNDDFCSVRMIDGGGGVVSSLTFEQNAISATLKNEWQLVTIDDITTEQFGPVTTTATSVTQALTKTFDLTRSSVLFTHLAAAGTTTQIGQKLPTARFSAGNELTFERGIGTSSITIYGQAIEWPATWKVQSGQMTMAATVSTNTVAIDEVSSSAFVMIGGHQHRVGRTTHATDDDVASAAVKSTFTNTTTLSLSRGRINSSDATISWYVIDPEPPVGGGGTAPDIPTNLDVAVVSSTSLSVSWTDAPTGSTHDLRWSTDNATWTEITGVTSPYAHTGRTPETTYYYQVRATNAYGTSDWSASDSATTSAAPVPGTYLWVQTGKMLDIAAGNLSPTLYNWRWFYTSNDGENWTPTYTGSQYMAAAQGNLMNARCANALFQDEGHIGDGTHAYANIAGFDPEANVQNLIDALPSYKEHGVIAITVGMQGGSTGYSYSVEDGHTQHMVSAYDANGDLRIGTGTITAPESGTWWDRAKRLIEAARDNGMIVILSLFYQRCDEIITVDNTNHTYIKNAIDNSCDFLYQNDLRNVIVEIANEYNIATRFQHNYLYTNSSTDGIGAAVRQAQAWFTNNSTWKIPVSASSTTPASWDDNEVYTVADVALVHGNAIEDFRDPNPHDTTTQMQNVLNVTDYPVVMNEDDNYTNNDSSNNFANQNNLNAEIEAMTECFNLGCGWGTMFKQYTQNYEAGDGWWKFELGPTADVTTQANIYHAVFDGIQNLTIDPTYAAEVPAVGHGVNLAVAEFAPEQIPGTLHTHYTYPAEWAYDYWDSKGVGIIRLPFRWERIQRTLGGALHETDMLLIDDQVTWASARGMKVMLDMHNYGRYRIPDGQGGYTEHIIGDDDGVVTQAHFEDVWTRLATRYVGQPVIYGLMNEPHDMPTTQSAGTETPIHTFDAGVESWVYNPGTGDEPVTHYTDITQSGAGAIGLSDTVTAGANRRLAVYSTQTYPSGTTFYAWVYVPAGITGITARIDIFNSSWANVAGPATTLTPGEWTRIIHAPADADLVDTRGRIVQFSNDSGSQQTFIMRVDNFGTVEGITTVSGFDLWKNNAQAAVNAIRAVDTDNAISTCGAGWSGAHSWRTENENFTLTDPSGTDNIWYEAHQYFDANSSGQYAGTYDGEGVTATTGADRVAGFLQWLIDHDKKGFIGEYGIPRSEDARYYTTLNNFLAAIDGSTKIMGSTYWAAGPWWNTADAGDLNVEPTGTWPSTTDAPQFPTLEPYFLGLAEVTILPSSISTQETFGAPVITGGGDNVLSGPYADLVLAHPALELLWVMDDESTQVTDYSGNARHGTLSGTYTQNEASLLASQEEASTHLTRTGQGKVTGPTINMGTLDASGFSYEVWVHPISFQLSSPYISAIMGMEPSGGSVANRVFLRWGDADINPGQIQFSIALSGSERKVTSPLTYTTGQTYHIVATYGGSNIRLYVNGSEVASSAQTGTLEANEVFMLNQLWGERWGDQRFGWAAYYSSPLTAQEVADHYNAGITDASVQQISRPTNIVTAGSWSVVGAANLYDAVNEETVDDSSYIQSEENPANDTVEFTLAALGTPETRTNHVVHYRFAEDINSSGAQTLIVQLVEGTTVIAQKTETPTTTLTDGTLTLTEAEAQAITDYTNLRIRFIANTT